MCIKTEIIHNSTGFNTHAEISKRQQNALVNTIRTLILSLDKDVLIGACRTVGG
jgi:hypothetical protein